MRIRFLIIGLLVCLNAVAWNIVFSSSSDLEVVFFDIGQGDSIFIEAGGTQILIDGGPSSEVVEKVGEQMPMGDRVIDLVVLTHPEHDHYGGLIDVLKAYEVKNVLWTGVFNPSNEYGEWMRLLDEEGANIVIAQLGQVIYGNGFHIEVLYPFDSFEGVETKELNNSSVVLKLYHGENAFLFTGDIFKSVERMLLGQGVDADVLKISHHGSKTSSDPLFVEAVSPEIAVIQCGRENKYGHPHLETLEVLSKYDINILRTDKDGDVKVVSNGSDFEIIK